MKQILIKANAFLKGFILLLAPGVWLGFLSRPLLFLSNLLELSRWIQKHKGEASFNDFYTPGRDHNRRYGLYEHVIKTQNLQNEAVHYLEFGVSHGFSFRWWIEHNQNPDSRFYGFDTFEGLPENWGPMFKKGAMIANVPSIDDSRHEFVKGLFQDTLYDFIKTHPINDGKRKIIHMDADLYSATLFVLGTLAPYLNEGDVILFDEFNVPNSEFLAFKSFVDAFYLKYELLGAVNNFYQIAVIVKK
jgi:hypothetical protein